MADTHEMLQTLLGKVSTVENEVSIIKTVLLGVPETQNGGLVASVNKQWKVIEEQRRAISSIRRYLWILMGGMIGGGGLGVGISRILGG